MTRSGDGSGKGEGPTELTPFEAVFGQRVGRRSSFVPGGPLPWLIALGVHGAFVLMANSSGPSLETWGARMAATIHDDLAAVSATTIIPPLPPEVERNVPDPPDVVAEPVPERRVAPSARTARTTTPTPSTEPAPAPAQAADVLAAAPDPSAPVDLTDVPFVTGTADQYAGGTTTSDGTNSRAVDSAAVTPSGQDAPTDGAAGGARSQARPVGLAQRWRCDWPRLAPADLYEQQVTLRVVVRPDGHVESARVISDPGHGFGAATLACAHRTLFTPARNEAGEAIRATSPPVRVRFTR